MLACAAAGDLHVAGERRVDAGVESAATAGSGRSGTSIGQ
jgi:hypothetical protein